ncbi:MAG: LysR family transcriptional regulator [Ramlibacter sp.]|nr:LysR family transcriptional regulator [Ramlibacter sp.]
METLANLESFVRSAEAGTFSAAARQLGLTPAAVSRNVTMLERNLGVRLFQRSTRQLALTECGEQFRSEIALKLEGLRAAITNVAVARGEPAGVLKISACPAFCIKHILPMLPAFLERYPRIRLQWHFDNRVTNLIAEGYDAAIGGGFELPPGMVARPLAPAHLIAVASPSYVKRHKSPDAPGDLVALDGIVMHSDHTGRVRQWTMRNGEGDQVPARLDGKIMVNDSAAMCRCAVLGLGVALLAVPDAWHELQDRRLMRLLPGWYADAGDISLYWAHRKLLAAKTRAFIDHVVDVARHDCWARRFAADTAVDAGDLRVVNDEP